MNVLSLFAGIGGLELGLERAGMTVVGQVEIDPYCQRVLAKHWPEVPRHDDVRTAVEWWRGDSRPVVDLVCGGFPCQPVSTAGKRLTQEDPRWLWPALHTVIRALEPRYVLIENVPGLLHPQRVVARRCVCGWPDRWGGISDHPTKPRLVFGPRGGRNDGTSPSGIAVDASEVWREGFEVARSHSEMGSSLAVAPIRSRGHRVPATDSANAEAQGATGGPDLGVGVGTSTLTRSGEAEGTDQRTQPEGAEGCPDCGRPMVGFATVAPSGAADVLGDLAGLGYDSEWDRVPAAFVGAPHIRGRIFIVAYPQRARGDRLHEWSQPGHLATNPPRGRADGADRAAADDHSSGVPGQRPAGGEADVANAGGGRHGLSPRVLRPGRHSPVDRGWWPPESGLARVANGIPNRMDRRRALGNAVVPQVAQHIGDLIMAADQDREGAA